MNHGVNRCTFIHKKTCASAPQTLPITQFLTSCVWVSFRWPALTGRPLLQMEAAKRQHRMSETVWPHIGFFRLFSEPVMSLSRSRDWEKAELHPGQVASLSLALTVYRELDNLRFWECMVWKFFLYVCRFLMFCIRWWIGEPWPCAGSGLEEGRFVAARDWRTIL